MEKAGENVEKPTYCGKQVESDENSSPKTRAEIRAKGETEMNKKQKKMLKQIIAAVILVAILKLLPSFPTPVELVLYCIPYLVVGWDVLRKAIKGIKNRQPFDECFLMAVATVGAFALGDYVEGCAVIIFYQIGELFQSVAVGKSRQSISSLMDIRPDYANIEGEDGKLEQVDPDEVEIGTTIVVQPGERIPIDGIIRGGHFGPEHRRPHRREPAPGRQGRGRGHQRLRQRHRPAEGSAPPRNSANPPSPRFWTSWKTPA